MKKCPKCHNIYEDSMNFCTVCGCMLEWEDKSEKSIGENPPHKGITKRKWFRKVLRILLIVLFAACAGYVYWYYSQPVYYIYPEISTIDGDADGGELIVKINTDAPYSSWEVDAPNWMDISKGEDFIKIKYKANQEDCEYSDYQRKGTIELICADRNHTTEEIVVRQPESTKYPRASIKKEWLTKEESGIIIHVNVNTRYMAYDDGLCVVFFEDTKGNTLTSNSGDSEYLNSENQIVTTQHFEPEEAKQTIYDIQLFVPYYMFPIKNAGKIGYDVYVRKKIDGEWEDIAHEFDSFDLTRREIESVKFEDDVLPCDSAK